MGGSQRHWPATHGTNRLIGLIGLALPFSLLYPGGGQPFTVASLTDKLAL